MKFGIGKLDVGKGCQVYPCSNIAKNFIGVLSQPYYLNNLCLCDKHLSELKSLVGGEKEDLYKEFVQEMYNSSGSMTKANMIKFCADKNIQLPEDIQSMKNKDFMVLIFPDLFKKDEVNENAKTIG